MKRQFALWSPQYFRPRDGAEQMHAFYLEYIVGSADHATYVLDDQGTVEGFFAVVPQTRHQWVDDLYLREGGRWAGAIAAISDVVDDPWVTCVSRFDDVRAGALGGAGLAVASSFWSRSLDDVTPSALTSPPGPVDASRDVPRHTFGPAPFDPSAPGALVVTDGDGGQLVGSPGVKPPLYDPGGPACVVDSVHGGDRRGLLLAGMSAAGARGDAAIVVVCGSDDDELRSILSIEGFRAEVDLFAT